MMLLQSYYKYISMGDIHVYTKLHGKPSKNINHSHFTWKLLFLWAGDTYLTLSGLHVCFLWWSNFCIVTVYLLAIRKTGFLVKSRVKFFFLLSTEGIFKVYSNEFAFPDSLNQLV